MPFNFQTLAKAAAYSVLRETKPNLYYEFKKIIHREKLSEEEFMHLDTRTQMNVYIYTRDLTPEQRQVGISYAQTM